MIAILLKELREHIGFVFALGWVAGMGVLATLGMASEQGLDVLHGFALFSQFVIAVPALLLTGRILPREYQRDTHPFLLSLPLRWWSVIAVKMTLSYLILLSLALGYLVIVFAIASQSALPEGLFIPCLIRITTVATFHFAFFAAATQLGKYRYIVYLMLFLAVLVAQSQSGFDTSSFGPFALVGERFGSETTLDYEALTVSWLWIGALVTAAVAFQCVERGAWAASLAQRMSYREKLFTALMAVLTLMVMTRLLEHNVVEDYTIPGAVLHEREGIYIEIFDGVDRSQEGEAETTPFGKRLADSLLQLRQELQIEAFPPVYIELASHLDGSRFEFQNYAEIPGVFARANWQVSDWRSSEFRAALAREVLLAYSAENLAREERKWVLDGFCSLWARGGLDADEFSNVLKRRAVYGSLAGDVRLRPWLSMHARHGDDIATALAAAAIWELRTSVSADAARGFARKVLCAETGYHFGALLQLPSVDRALRRSADIDIEELQERLQERLAAWAVDDPDAATWWTLSGAAECRDGEDWRSLSLHCRCDPESTAGVERIAVQWQAIVQRRALPLPNEVEEFVIPPDGSWTKVTGDLARGSIIQWTLRGYVPALQCEVLSGWEPLEVPR
ncbi:MAG: hypothetical protein AAF581_06610 [Planctomycetota bacterium]